MLVLSAASVFALEPLDAVSGEDVGIEPLTVAEPPADLGDVPLRPVGKVGTRPVVVNPKNASQVVAAFVTEAGCYTRASVNGGRSWAPAKKLPLAADMPICDVPTLLWSTDGSRVYAAFFYRRNDAHGWMLSGGAAVSSSRDGGVTWSAPVKAIDFPDVNAPPLLSEFGYTRIFLATPVGPSDANYVYLLADMTIQSVTGFDFTRSSDRGATWSPRKVLRAGTYFGGGDFGEAIAGGPGGEILFSAGRWDTFDPPPTKSLEVFRSSDYGRTFKKSVIAPDVGTYETDVAFGAGGAAHIVYAETGDGSSRIRYTRSLRPPYTSWSAPVTLGSDIHNGEQNVTRPALVVSPCGSAGSVPQVVWLSDWTGPESFNVYYTRKLAGNPWSDSLRVSDYTLAQGDSAEVNFAAAAGKAIAVWGAAGWSTNPFVVWSSRIAPGISCPQ